MRSRCLTVISALVISSSAMAQDSPADTTFEDYSADVITLPLGVGFRIPSYDRVNGLSIPWGPEIQTRDGRFRGDIVVTYRTHLEKVDATGKAVLALTKADSLSVSGGRGTFSNDEWIRSNLVNSAAAFFVGSDARNYYRADRVNAELIHGITRDPWAVSLWAGGNYERDWSTGVSVPHDDAPWSLFNRKDPLKMRRPNPKIIPGHIASGLAGTRGRYETPELKSKWDVKVEQAFDSPELLADDGGKFTQLTVDTKSSFPTFGMQSFNFQLHGVVSSDAPPQRYAYLGGAGTLATVDLLALGGDQLLFVEGEYLFPLTRPLLPFVGAPVLSARYAAGSAGVDYLPRFIQNIGVGIGLKIVKIQYHIDPSYKKTPFTDKSAFSIGFSLSL